MGISYNIYIGPSIVLRNCDIDKVSEFVEKHMPDWTIRRPEDHEPGDPIILYPFSDSEQKKLGATHVTHVYSYQFYKETPYVSMVGFNNSGHWIDVLVNKDGKEYCDKLTKEFGLQNFGVDYGLVFDVV